MRNYLTFCEIAQFFGRYYEADIARRPSSDQPFGIGRCVRCAACDFHGQELQKNRNRTSTNRSESVRCTARLALSHGLASRPFTRLGTDIARRPTVRNRAVCSIRILCFFGPRVAKADIARRPTVRHPFGARPGISRPDNLRMHRTHRSVPRAMLR